MVGSAEAHGNRYAGKYQTTLDSRVPIAGVEERMSLAERFFLEQLG